MEYSGHTNFLVFLIIGGSCIGCGNGSGGIIGSASGSGSGSAIASVNGSGSASGSGIDGRWTYTVCYFLFKILPGKSSPFFPYFLFSFPFSLHFAPEMMRKSYIYRVSRKYEIVRSIIYSLLLPLPARHLDDSKPEVEKKKR